MEKRYLFLVLGLFLPLLQLFNLKAMEENAKEDTCGICREVLSCSAYGEPVALPCHSKHRFHSNCINDWFAINRTCPICRTALSDDQLRAIGLRLIAKKGPGRCRRAFSRFWRALCELLDYTLENHIEFSPL